MVNRITILLLVFAAIGLLPGSITGAVQTMQSVQQFGITWTFSEPVPVGRFVNGDYYVVGPVTVVGIEPKPLVGDQVPLDQVGEWEGARVPRNQHLRNGSVVNPPAKQEAGFDSGIRNFYNPELTDVPPFSLKPGDCVVSTISLKPGEEVSFPYHGGSGGRGHRDNSPVKTAAILTCVTEPQPPDAFRPAYGDREQIVYRARNLKRDLLPRLPPPPETPKVETWIRVFERPWINLGFFGFEQPMENMPHYGQWVGQAQSMGGLLLMLDMDPDRKEQLLINFIQVGIDYWGLVRNGHPGWEGWGGHGSGRKFPIVFAGILLGDDEMACPGKSFPKAEFGEDNQTTYGDGWTGAAALFAGHSGIQNATESSKRAKWGPYEHIHPRDWTSSQLQSESYRRANTSSSWVGQALVIRLLHAEKQWNHNPFLDYVDRWMTEPDDEDHRAIIMQHHPTAGFTDRARFTHQGFTWEPFVQVMWDRHRSSAPVSGAHSRTNADTSN